MFPLTGGLFLGWAIGANDAANVFGTAVASRVVSFRKAAVLCGLCVILGATLQGYNCIHTVRSLAGQDMLSMVTASVAAAMIVILMIFLGVSVSASQSIIGALAGVGLATGTLNVENLEKVIICWLVTPFCAMIIAGCLFKICDRYVMRLPMSMLTRDKLLLSGLLVIGSYGSYAIGANNAANAVGIFSGQIPHVGDRLLALLGGLAIASGVLSYGKRMMLVVGSKLMPVDAFTAFIVVFATAVTVHVFALIGVPVSARQAVVGAIIGIGCIRGLHTIKFKELKTIAIGWILTPLAALMLSSSIYSIISANR